MAQHPCRPAQYLQYMRRMYDRHDALCDACDHVRWAAESLRQCRDVALSEDIAALEQIEVVRLCTRAPCVNPVRVTKALAQRLRACGKVWVNTQFNCAGELTPEATAACGLLVDAGIPVSCQTVLLAGVNDSVEAMLALFRALQRARVRPYYVFQCDPVAGVSHFRVPLERAKQIAAGCAERIGGLALPRFVADLPSAKRKIPIEELVDGRW